jgi:LmbE family N-acetylglucosaminyl deacetylase
MKKWLSFLGMIAIGLAALSGYEPLPQDTGAAGTYQKLLKLKTIASVMHTTAHPDDEHGGLLAWLSRGMGARVSLLTLNRGQSGDNALGPQLFDGLGLIRTEELLASNRYYGVDAQYFTSVIDFGFSKRLEETLDKWGRETALRDVVRIIRMERPLVLVSRFQGTQRDGHGNHQTAGLVTLDAFRAAGDPKRFPEQIAEGLRPWQPRKVYIGGMREDEPWTVRVDPGQYSPWLGLSYGDFARIGLSYQRSQNSGRLALTPGPQYGYYKRADSPSAAGAGGLEALPANLSGSRENGFFDGINTSVGGIFSALRRPEPAGAAGHLQPIVQAVDEAIQRFSIVDPSASVPALARGLTATRAAIDAFASEPDAVFILRRKEAQFMDAISTAMGVALMAVAQPAGAADPVGPAAAFAAPPVMGPVVPGQTFDVRVTFISRGTPAIALDNIAVEAGRGWTATAAPATSSSPPAQNEPVTRRFSVALAPDTPLSSKPYFHRANFQDARYAITDPAQFGRPASVEPAVAVVKYRVEGAVVEARETVRRREAKLPYGYVMRELRVVPALAVTSNPATVVVPVKAQTKRVSVQVDVLNNRDSGSKGELTLRLPQGWSADPPRVPFTFARGGERATYNFTVTIPSIADRAYQIEAVATADGREYREGYETIDYRDLEARLLYRPSVTDVRGVDVEVVPGLTVGYVMGVGDQVPEGIRQLGYSVTMLDESELARGNLSRFDAIVTGTRAYAVREDLKTYNRRLLDYVEQGGNLIVLYNTQELVPSLWAPKPGELTARAEEVSEEASPVDILAPDAPMLQWPNKITKADFNDWVEQRGSKFWNSWDPAYRPIIAARDQGQAPQQGGWLWLRHGKGHYTYFAYAMHRQLPYGVPGAYRLMANLLALSKNRDQGSGIRDQDKH